MLFAQQHASLHGKTCTKPAAATTATTTPTKQASQLAYLQHSHRAMVAPVHAPLNCLSPHSSSTMARSLGTPRAARSAAAASLASSTPSPQADDGVNVDEIMLSFGTVAAHFSTSAHSSTITPTMSTTPATTFSTLRISGTPQPTSRRSKRDRPDSEDHDDDSQFIQCKSLRVSHWPTVRSAIHGQQLHGANIEASTASTTSTTTHPRLEGDAPAAATTASSSPTTAPATGGAGSGAGAGSGSDDSQHQAQPAAIALSSASAQLAPTVAALQVAARSMPRARRVDPMRPTSLPPRRRARRRSAHIDALVAQAASRSIATVRRAVHGAAAGTVAAGTAAAGTQQCNDPCALRSRNNHVCSPLGGVAGSNAATTTGALPSAASKPKVVKYYVALETQGPDGRIRRRVISRNALVNLRPGTYRTRMVIAGTDLYTSLHDLVVSSVCVVKRTSDPARARSGRVVYGGGVGSLVSSSANVARTAAPAAAITGPLGRTFTPLQLCANGTTMLLSAPFTVQRGELMQVNTVIAPRSSVEAAGSYRQLSSKPGVTLFGHQLQTL